MANRRLSCVSPATGVTYKCDLTVPPDGIPHYTHNPHLPIFFYGGWMSSMAPYRFRSRMLIDDNDVLPTYWETREHWFHAHKSTDVQVIDAINCMEDPWAAKKLGNSRTAFTIREGWDDGLSYETMLEGIRRQLDQYEHLQFQLRQTGDRFIAEVSSQGDMIWGIHDPASGAWDGQNLLGAAWMDARAEL